MFRKYSSYLILVSFFVFGTSCKLLIPKKIVIKHDQPNLIVKERNRVFIVKTKYTLEYFTTDIPTFYKYSKFTEIDTVDNVIYLSGHYGPILGKDNVVMTFGTMYKGFKFKIKKSELDSGTYIIHAGSSNYKFLDTIYVK